MKESFIFSKFRENTVAYEDESRASIKGVGIKTLFLVLLTIASAVLTSIYVPKAFESEEKLMTLIVILFASSIIAAISFFLGRFFENISHICGVVYALAEGISLGFITTIVELYVPGVGITALGATLIIFAVVAVLFSLGFVRATRKLFAILIALLISAILLSIMTIFVAFVGSYTDYLWVCLAVEGIMLLFETVFLIFNFQEASDIVEAGCPKQSEWPVALGLTVTLVYIYIRILRILLYVASLVGKNK